MTRLRRLDAAEPAAPGDGHALPRFRWWQVLRRSLFHLRLDGRDGASEIWSVDVRHAGDVNGVVHAELYRDGRHDARSTLPARFAVSGGVIEVVASGFGLRRAHYVTEGGTERQLVPDRASAEGRRARLDRRHPALSRAVAASSMVILIVGVVLGVPQLVQEITQIPLVADLVGTFNSPVHAPAWVNTLLLVATLLASTERALRLRYNWLLDGGILDGQE